MVRLAYRRRPYRRRVRMAGWVGVLGRGGYRAGACLGGPRRRVGRAAYCVARAGLPLEGFLVAVVSGVGVSAAGTGWVPESAGFPATRTFAGPVMVRVFPVAT